MNIFYFSAEVEPFAKSGGLGDVLGALPKAVAKDKNNTVYVVMPYYCDVIKSQYKCQTEFLGYFYTDVNWRHQYVGVLSLVKDNVHYLFLDNEYYFQGPMYCFADNERFSYFCKACLDLVSWLGVEAHVLHCNDWSTGLIPVLRHAFYQNCLQLKNSKTVYTIHNLRYQGWMNVEECKDLTGLNDFYFAPDRLLHNGGVNLMKGAIVFSDAVTTVSPTYAAEICTDAYGEGLSGVVNAHRGKICGILNGIDYDVNDPVKDKLIFANYTVDNVDEGKAKNKAELQKRLGLPVRKNTAMLGLVSRFVDQKGLELVVDVLEEILSRDVQLVVLGTGEKRYENMFKDCAFRHKDKVSANVFFDNSLAHQIYAASDFVLVPSVFEPCGLTQLIALRYGAVPVVRETGGLKDTVTSYNEQTGEGNGFSFTHCNAHDFAFTVNRALNFYYEQSDVFAKIRMRGMRQDFSWTESSRKYSQLYKSLTGK
ncbi:MAG: glycogen synthase [Corallococcus sp.]|nr:glycogen synthase [Corallococcus sp.]MCM1359306.1 glycogen synthase [Corallococcus sp.]MCM1394883.1 glycogen synthase [Corallococcus sp.]